MMKKLCGLITMLLLFTMGVQVCAATQLAVPTATKVLWIYEYNNATRDVPEDSLYRSDRQDIIKDVCNALTSLNGAKESRNIANIKPADRVIELRTGNGNIMRYHVYSSVLNKQHSDQIILQKVESGTPYQGIGYTGGNISTVISKLSSALNGTTQIWMPFSLGVGEVERIELFNYTDLTYTRLVSNKDIDYAMNLMRASVDGPNAYRAAREGDCGKLLSDLSGIALSLSDGTRFQFDFYQQGIRVLENKGNLNAPVSVLYKTDTVVYPKLVTFLRQKHSQSGPAWLGIMNVDGISEIQILNARGTRMKTLKPGDKQYEFLMDELTSLTVQPSSLRKLAKRSGLSEALNLHIKFASGEWYTLDYGKSMLEIEASNMGYVVSYQFPSGYDGRWFIDSLLS